MYMCSCKALTESDVKEMARSLISAGVPSIEKFLALLELDDEDACGLCTQAPEQFTELAVEEWTRLGIGYEVSAWEP